MSAERGHNDHFYGNIWLKLAKNRPKNKYIRLPVVSIMKLKAALAVSASIFFSSPCLWKENKGCHLKGHECLCQNCGCFLEILNLMLEFLILMLAAFYQGSLLEAETLSIDNAFLFYGSFWGYGKRWGGGFLLNSRNAVSCVFAVKHFLKTHFY